MAQCETGRKVLGAIGTNSFLAICGRCDNYMMRPMFLATMENAW